MATWKQIEANRLNAQKSTGPRTEEGKRASSQNALKSGLDAESQFVLGESREEFAQLRADYFDRFRPATPDQRFQVDNLIRNEWLLRRYHRVESQLWEYQISLCDRSSQAPLGQAFSKASTIFMRLQRRITAAEKAYKEAMAELTRLQPPPKLASFPTPQPQSQANPRPPAEGPQSQASPRPQAPSSQPPVAALSLTA